MDLMSSYCAETELPTASGQWVQRLPAGCFQGRDGHSFALDDPAARPASGEVPAVGWIKQIEARGDGIWGVVDWTETARNMIHIAISARCCTITPMAGSFA